MNFRVAILQKKSLTGKYQENTDVILQKMKEFHFLKAHNVASF